MSFTPNPVAFTIFGIEIRWYAILICTGIILATFFACRRAERHGLKSDDILDLLLVSLPLGIIGARLYYVIFNWDSYSGDWLSIINIRLGGLAIHGGLLAGILAAIIMCRYKKINPLNLMDLAAPCIALAQGIGRWGNFVNAEAHGGPTTVPWAIEVNGQMVHPTFLYESIWCIFLFLLLSYLDRKQHFTGQIFLLYGGLYSLERFFVEQLRTDSLMFGQFKVAQLVSLLTMIICAVFYILLYKKYKSEASALSDTKETVNLNNIDETDLSETDHQDEVEGEK